MVEILYCSDEEWLPIYLNNELTSYSVSNFGNVKNVKTERILKPWKTPDGYYYVKICHGGIEYNRRISRLVLSAFEPIHPDYQDQVNHIDGKNKWDNTRKNLNWKSCSENILLSYQTKLRIPSYCETNPTATHTNEQVHEICKCIVKGMSNKEIGERLHLDDVYFISNIRSGKSWTPISSQYDIRIKSHKRIKNQEGLIRDICELIILDYRNKDIKKILQLDSTHLIEHVRSGKRYLDIIKDYDIGKVKGSTTIEIQYNYPEE